MGFELSVAKIFSQGAQPGETGSSGETGLLGGAGGVSGFSKLCFFGRIKRKRTWAYVRSETLIVRSPTGNDSLTEQLELCHSHKPFLTPKSTEGSS